MPRLSRYILKQLIMPVLLFAFLMTCVIWLTQALRLLDLVINRGQSAPTFVYMTLLILPNLLVIILPVAFFAGSLYALSRLSGESELVVMASAGVSPFRLSVPVLGAAGIVMVLTYACSLYLMPLAQREMKDTVVGIRADIGSALLTEGAFNTPVKGLTVFIREIGNDGRIRGVLVHDSRNAKNPTTYLAQTGMLVQTKDGARLILENGTIEQTARDGAQLNMLKFARYPFNLDQFSSPAKVTERSANEMFLSELFHPDPSLKGKNQRAYIIEGHNRLSSPLYCLAFAFIALVGASRGRRARGAHALRMTLICLGAVLLRVAGYGVQGLASHNTAYCVLFYLIPVLGMLGAMAMYFGRLSRHFCPLRKAAI